MWESTQAPLGLLQVNRYLLGLWVRGLSIGVEREWAAVCIHSQCVTEVGKKTFTHAKGVADLCGTQLDI
jgi:hypothetical protein